MARGLLDVLREFSDNENDFISVMETVARMSEDGGRFICPLINFFRLVAKQHVVVRLFAVVILYLVTRTQAKIHAHCVCLVVVQSPQCELNSWSRSLISPCSYTRVGPTSQQLFPDIWSPLLSDILPIRTIRYVWKSFLFNENSSCKFKLFFFFNLRFRLYKYEKNKRINTASFTETANLVFAFSFRCGRPAKQRCSSFWSRASSPKPIWRPKYVQFCSS